MAEQKRQTLSIVSPCYNEETVVEAFYDRAAKVADKLPDYEVEFVFVDDGSKDATAQKLRELVSRDPRVKAVLLSRNFGHQRAITAGLEHCSGDYIVMMDVDLQDPPELITEIVAQFEAGYDLVHTVRADRRVDPFFKRITAKMFYQLMKRWVLRDMLEDAGDFKGFNRKVLNALEGYRERVRFLRGTFATIGFKQTKVEFVREMRHSGQSKYPTWNMLRFARDAIVSNSVLPLRMSFYLGLFFMGLLPLFVLWALFAFWRGAALDPLMLLLIGLLLFFSSVNLMMFGAVGEYIKVLVLETKQRPLYIVGELVGNFGEKSQTGRS